MNKSKSQTNTIRKYIIPILLIFISSVCSRDKSDAERILEDGLEVVINRHEPYIVEGETKTLNLEEDFIIDLEEDEIAKLGLTDVWGFDVDSNRNIYFF
jgi:hypothetical protein